MIWHDLMIHLTLFLLFTLRSQSQDVQNTMPYPQFFQQPQKQSVKREMTTTIKCGAYGGIGQLTYTFYKGDTPQYNMMTRLKTLTADPDTGIASYFIMKVTSDHAGYYQCVVKDGASVVIYSNVIYLHVVDNYLSRNMPLRTIPVKLLSTARLHVLNCTMPDSSPPAIPRWFKDGSPVDTDDSNMFISLGFGSIEAKKINIGDLVMFALNYSHSGIYTCAAYNQLLEDNNNQINVVHYNVTIGTSGYLGEYFSSEAIVSDIKINVGDEGYLFCGSIGNPAPRTEFLTISPQLEGISSEASRTGDPFRVSRVVKIPSTLTTTPNSYYSTCRVGQSYYTAKLVVMEPPIISVDSVSFTDAALSPIVYYTETDSPPRSLSCDTTDDTVAKQWFRNGQVWNMGAYHETDLGSGFDLIARDVRPEDSGVYQCKAFSGVLAIYRTQVLCVVKKLSIETVSPTLTEYEGRSKKLTCTIWGSPAPRMIWTYSGRELRSSDNIIITHNVLTYPFTTTLQILNISLSHAGRYNCGAKNYIPAFKSRDEWEDNVSATIVFKVQAPTRVTSPNTTVIAFASKPLVLQCTTYGEPKPTRPLWTHQDVPLDPVSGVLEIEDVEYDQGYVSTLTILSVSLFNQGNYTCSSWNVVNVNETDLVRISVPVISPINVSAPLYKQLEQGVSEGVTCVATGHPPASNITWFFGDQEITENILTTRVDQTLKSVLTVTAQNPNDTGLYKCYSTNSYRDTVYNDTALINTEYVSPVVIAATSREQTGVYGESLTVTCTSTGSPVPDKIIWESKGFLVRDTNIEIFSSFEENVLISRLLIKEVKYSNERSYNCSASNFFKGQRRHSSDSVDVIVEYPVQVRTYSNYAYNNKGKSVDVTCEIEGKPPPPEIYWYFSGYPGQDITQSQYYSFNTIQRDNVINATLRINELSPALIGDYNCSASNVVNGIRYYSSRVVNVEIVRRVIVSVLTGIKSVPKGSEANLTCSGEGVPPPNPEDIQWLFKGIILPSYSLKYLMGITSERIYKINSILRISDVQLNDGGDYTCRFSNVDKTNSSYSDEKTVQLVVQVPVEVSFNETDTLELFEKDTATLVCNIFGKPPPYKVTWVRSGTGEELETGGIFEIKTTNSSNGEVLASTLTIMSMSLELEGAYECRSENMLSSGKVVSNSAFRSVLRVENVTVAPKSIAVPGVVNSLARLVCSARGVPMPTEVTWFYKNRQEIKPVYESELYTVTQEKFFDDSRGIYTKLESTLTIKMVKWADKGTYECLASNLIRGEERSDKATTILNAGYPVALNKVSGEKYQVLLGGQVGTLSVPLYGYPAPNITWSKTTGTQLDTPQPQSYYYTIRYIPVEDYSGVSQLTFSLVSLAAEGNYTITASNTVHNTTYTVVFRLAVAVFYPPAISLDVSRDVLEMTSEKVACVVTSKPPPGEIRWEFEGRDLDLRNNSNLYNIEDMLVDNRGDLPVTIRSLVIKQARPGCSGKYTCRTSVLIANVLYNESRSIEVRVVSTVVVSTPLISMDVPMDTEVNVTCNANGWPKPNEIVWYYVNSSSSGDDAILLVQNRNIEIIDEQVSFKQIRSTVRIVTMTTDWLGTYICTSKNVVLGSQKSDKAHITLFEERIEAVGKTITSKEVTIIGVLAAIIFIVIVGVLVLLVYRHKSKKKKREQSRLKQKREVTLTNTNGGGADSTLRADQERTGLIQIDPNQEPDQIKGSRYREVVEYVELDPRVYKSDYARGKLQPMPRRKRNPDYATIGSTSSSQTNESKLI